MTFLNSALLAGLLLAGLPILIHLLGRRRLKRQPFPTLEFLRRLQVKRMRKLRIRQWLLLALRTLALLFLALAFLRPALTKSGSAGTRRDTVVLLDLSASMNAKRPGGSAISLARKTLEGIHQAAGQNSRLALVIADGTGSRDLGWMTGRETEPRWISQLETDGRSADLSDSWIRAGKMLTETASPNKELIWISDFCDECPDTLVPLPDGVSVLQVPVAQRPAVNLFIQEVHPAYAEGSKGKSIDLDVTIGSSGGDAAHDVLVSISLDRRKLAEATVTVPVEGTVTKRFTLLPNKTGAIAGEIDIDVDDALSLDNRLAFVLQVPGTQQVLVLGSDQQAQRFFKLALDPQGQASRFAVTTKPGGLQGLDLGRYDAVVFAGVPAFSNAETQVLLQYLENGGGAWLLLGNQVDLASYNRDILQALGYGPLVSTNENVSGMWESIDTKHPALQGLIAGKGRYDQPSVKRYARQVPSDDDQVLVRLTTGAPFIVEREVGTGRIWLTPSAADTSWTDWPFSGIFAPLVQQGMHYLASGEGSIREQISCGEPIFWSLPEGIDPGMLETIDPLGNRQPAVPGFHEDLEVLVSDQTFWPGLYRLVHGSTELDLMAVRTVLAESEIQPEQKQYANHISGSMNPGEPEEVVEWLSNYRHGREISWWFLTLALAALIAETLVARENKPGLEPGQPAETETS